MTGWSGSSTATAGASPRVAAATARSSRPATWSSGTSQTGAQQTYDFGPNSFPGEFVFVQDDDAAGEDEGWVIGFVYDAAEDSSDLVILDGSAPGTDPVARVHLPQRVPFGFHGSWVDDSIL